MRCKKKLKRFCLAFALIVVLLLCIVLSVEYSRKKYLDRHEEKFHTALSCIDNAFSLTDSELDETYGCTTYRFSYHGDPDAFIELFIEFCNILQDDVFPNPGYESNAVIYVISCNNSTYLIHTNGYFNRIETNIYLDDYFIFEDFNNIKTLMINNDSFTEEQTAHIISIQDKYSFNISLD